MAVIDSRTAGVLRPLSGTNTDEVETRLRLFVSDVTGIDQKLVRKRWMAKPGTQPGLSSDWCAVGVNSVKTHGLPSFRGHKGNIYDPVSGDIESESHQTLSCLASFYGPNASEYADMFRDGLQLPQNNSALQSMGLTVQGVADEVRHSPDFLLQQWVDRYDVAFNIGRKITRTYGVRTIASADVEIITERGKL